MKNRNLDSSLRQNNFGGAVLLLKGEIKILFYWLIFLDFSILSISLLVTVQVSFTLLVSLFLLYPLQVHPVLMVIGLILLNGEGKNPLFGASVP